MDEYLILRLQGPMQSWGDHTYEDFRPTLPFVTRSGLLGLLACCLGLDRQDVDNQQKLAESITYAVRIDEREIEPSKITDYHTIQEVLVTDGSIRANGVISEREYLCDTHFTTAIKCGKGSVYSIADLVAAVKRPIYTPVLGRRSCPITRPLFDMVIKAISFSGALALAPPGQGLIYSEQDEDAVSKLKIRDVPTFVKSKINNGMFIKKFATRTVYVLGNAAKV